MIAKKLSRLKISARRAMTLLQALVLVGATLVPFIVAQPASAAQLTNRFATVDTATPNASTSITFGFRLPSSTAIQSIEIDFCDAPLGTCASTNTPTLPASASPTVTINANWTNATVFAGGSYLLGNVASGGTNNRMRLTRTQVAAETQSGVLDRTIQITGLTNKNSVNKSYYPRILLFSDTAYTTLVHDGAVAQSTNTTLTVNARVQEVLVFCIGTTPTDSGTTQIRNTANSADVTTCSAADGTSVDLGSVDSSHINITPVGSTQQGDSKLAYAMVQTNAQNGVVIGYRAIQDTSSGKLKVVGATCSGVTTTDQCFNSQGATSAVFASGTENFGMTIAGVNCTNAGTNYGVTCNSTTTGNHNLCPKTNYQYSGSYTCGTALTYDTVSGYQLTSTSRYAWVDTGSSITNIAGSDAATLKVVANEALMLKFAATAQITTPTGLYQAQADFVATPTF